MRLLHEHPTVKLEANWLRQICFEAGVDDGGFREVDRPEGTASCKPM
jgi:hypothetical protein